MGRKSMEDERRAQILEGFYTCAVREGLGNASMKKIAVEAGVQTSLLYHYFSNR
jgi:AcrR family transcriptional regulator